MICRSSILRWSAVVALGLSLAFASRQASADTQALEGKPAPNITLKTTNDKDLNLSNLKGKVVVVDFWATWCPPCRASLPHLQKLSADKEMFAKGLRVVAVNAREDKPTIEAFMQKHGYTFVVPMDAAGSAMGSYAVEGIPTTVVIGRDGVIRKVQVGWDGGKSVDEAVEAALSESK